jgi:hypothetical protein
MNQRDILSSLFWFGVAVFVIIMAFKLNIGSFSEPGPGFMLFWASVLLGILAIVLFFRSTFKGLGAQKVKLRQLWPNLGWLNVLTGVMALLLYGFFLKWAGFLLSTFAFMVILYAAGKLRPWWLAMSSAVLTVILAYVLFHFGLQVQFPKGPINW